MDLSRLVTVRDVELEPLLAWCVAALIFARLGVSRHPQLLAVDRQSRHFVHGHDKLRAPDKNIENNPMQSRMRSLARTICPRKHFDTSGKSPAHFQYRAIRLRSVRLTVDVRCRQGRRAGRFYRGQGAPAGR